MYGIGSHQKWNIRAALLAFMMALVGGITHLQVGDAAAKKYTMAERFDAVWQTLADNYADPNMRGADWAAVRRELRPLAEKAKDEAAFDAVIDKMLAHLKDPMTFYVNPAEVAKAQKAQTPDDRLDIVGVGILLGQTPDGYVLAREILPKGPAARAGIKPGARIAAVDGKSAYKVPVTDIAQRIRGKSGTKVTLQVLDPNGTKRDVVLTRAAVRFTAEVKSSVLPGNIGYLYLPGGSEGIETKVLAQLRRLHRTDGLVLDLRSGWSGADLSHMTPMLRIAALFTDKPIGALVSRDGLVLLAPQLTWENTSEKSWWQSLFTPPPTAMDVYKKPMVVLVDDTSTWEILAKGLQETGRAKVVGRTTASEHGALAGAIELPDGSALSITAMYYASPKGNTLGSGMKPDITVPLDLAYLAARYKGNDPDVDAARNALLKQIAQTPRK